MSKIMKQRNKYLENLGLSIYDYGVNMKGDKNDKDFRIPRWKKQRKKYGFDERETWCLDQIFVEWIYSRFMMYKKIGGKVVNLKFHKVHYKGQKITQKEGIDIICDFCEDYLKTEFSNRYKYSQIFEADTMKLLGELMPYMWW